MNDTQTSAVPTSRSPARRRKSTRRSRRSVSNPNSSSVVRGWLAVRYLVHGAAGAAELERPRPKPLEVARHLAVERRADERRWRLGHGSGRLGRDVGDEQLFRDRLVERPVDVAQVPAEQVVELEVVLGRVVVAVPPEPVAALGDQQLLARPDERGVVGGRPRRIERLPRLGELAPGPVVVGVADPDVEVAVDPRAREDAVRTSVAPAHPSDIVTVVSSGCDASAP